MEIKQFIVIGSSFCGVISAKTLVDAGANVLMLDTGIVGENEIEKPEKSFIEIRKKATNQSDYLIGENFEALANLQKKNPIHLTPNRTFTTNKVENFLNWTSGEFVPIESLARGGLGNGWGLGSFVYSENELMETGLNVQKMQDSYKWVASKIGISGGNDASNEYATANLLNNQTAIPLDFNGQTLFENSIKNKEKLAKKGFVSGRTPLAISTENDINGDKFNEEDLDFYSTRNSSAYRPQVTLNELLKNNSFEYQKNQLVLSFSQIKSDLIEVFSLNIETNEKKSFFCKKLLLSAGTLGTARIVMRSLSINKLPIICNPYTYIPSLQIKHIGAKNTDYQTGLAQMSLYSDPNKKHTNVAMGSIYSYRSLMGFRLLKEFPMDSKNGMRFLKLIMPALNITGIFHPEYGSENKFIERISDDNSPTNDAMKSKYELSEYELLKLENTEKSFKKALWNLGTIPLKVQRNNHGASIHYGGSIPYDNALTKTPTLEKNGSLKGFPNVFVADGSGFQFLSGKGLTLTLMAHAHLVAKNALEQQ
jgi:hypothetical protein